MTLWLLGSNSNPSAKMAVEKTPCGDSVMSISAGTTAAFELTKGTCVEQGLDPEKTRSFVLFLKYLSARFLH